MRALLSSLAAAFLAMAALPAFADEPQQSSPFTPAEREALHAEIRAYLLQNPEVLQEMIQLLEQKQQAATAENDKTLVAMHAEEIFDDGFSWVGGNPEGSFTLVEFLDYQCGFCKRAQPDVVELLELRRRHPADRQGDADPRAGLRARGAGGGGDAGLAGPGEVRGAA